MNTKPQVGLSSILGTLLAIAGAIGVAYSAAKGNDFATAASAGGGAVALVATISSRCAQAVAMIRKGVTIAGPYIDAAQAALTDPDAPQTATTAGDGELSGDPRPQSERPGA